MSALIASVFINANTLYLYFMKNASFFNQKVKNKWKKQPKLLYIQMVSRWRFELQTLWLKVKCSTDWANRTIMNGCLGWIRTIGMSESKSDALPLGYEAIKWWKDMDLNHRTRRNRFTVCRVWPLRYPSKKNGAENRNWTRNLLITSQLLYQLSYSGMVGDIGLEPMTPCL